LQHSYEDAIKHLVEYIGKDPSIKKSPGIKRKARDTPLVANSTNVFLENEDEDIGGVDMPPINTILVDNAPNLIPILLQNMAYKTSLNPLQTIERELKNNDNLSTMEKDYICDLVNEGQLPTIGHFTLTIPSTNENTYVHPDSLQQMQQSHLELQTQHVDSASTPLMGVAPVQIDANATYGHLPGQTPFRTPHVLHFTANHYLLSHTTNIETERLLYSIHNVYTSPLTNPLPDLPYDLNEIILAVQRLPIPQPIQTTKCTKSAIYDISENIVRVLNDARDSSQMVWTFDANRKNSGSLKSELYHSDAFNEYYLLCRQEKTVPLVVILYYDDFRKFSKVAGSAGALYYTFANYHHDYISETSHIYLGALVHQDDDVWDVIDIVIDQLVKLYKPLRVFNRAVGKEIQVRTFLGMFLGDTPQRADFASLKRQNSSHPCVQCMIAYDNLHTDKIDALRDVHSTKAHFKAWLNVNTQQEQKDIEANTGIKPLLLPNKKLRLNPFWRLKKLYGFDIHTDSVIDWFHIGPIGIFKRHIKYLDEKVLNAKEITKLEQLTQCEEYKIFGRALPRYKVCIILLFY
jgi:hypothetical protein